MRIGGVYLHDTQGPIYIVAGAHEVGGRVSNWWEWKVVLNDGTLSERIFSGYGGQWKPVAHEKTVIIKIKHQSCR